MKVEQESCAGCRQRQGCREVYRKLGEEQGPSVVPGALAAFMVPSVAFIAALAVFDGVFGKFVGAEDLQTVLSLFAALVASWVCVLAVRGAGRRAGQKRQGGI